MGEFGVFYPQNGTNTYINDVLGICKDNGWHFALWDWRGSSGKEWNIENFQDVSATSGGLNSWETVLSYFYAPPVPEIISPLELDLVQVPVVYKWDSLTSYTKYDIEVYNDEGLFFADSNITNASYVNTNVLYLEGKHYYWRIRSKNPGGKAENISQWTELEDIYIPAITDKNSISENKYELYGNYPNPFNPSTVIKYSLPKGSFLTLRVYDLLGREIQTLVNEYREQGEYSTMFNSGNLASGIYIYKLTAVQNNNTVFSEVKKMILLK
ncbi:MAG: T9SS C-terminal target domain-containing protein [Ignavibacteriae bacterium]|nr:MAG: T9SS C-terminal target domain-containing protein [Ignavibacteriota bacterium]